MEFEYSRYRTRDGLIHRPSLDVILGYKSHTLLYKDALVDTGSDFVLLPLSIAELLGVEPDFEAVSDMVCACGDFFQSYESRYPIEITVNHRGFLPKKWVTHVKFVDAPVTPLLGHRGFLDQFDATFLGKKHLMKLQPKS